MATFRPDLAGLIPAASTPSLSGDPLMTMNDWATLAQAPQRSPGTVVSVRETPAGLMGPLFNHMFVHCDDGHRQLIARGGPTEGYDLGFVTPRNRTAAEVTSEASSKDYGAPYDTIATTFLPGVTADQAAAPARAHALGVDHFGNEYNGNSNSNSYAADVAEPLFGWRPHSDKTPGYQTHLRDNGSPPPSMANQFSNMLDQLPDLSPALRLLRYPSA